MKYIINPDNPPANFNKAEADFNGDGKLNARDITAIMKENNVMSSLPEDLSNLMRRAITLNVHLKNNRGDVANARGLQLIEARIRRLERYYKDNGVLPADWKYSINTAELMLK